MRKIIPLFFIFLLGCSSQPSLKKDLKEEQTIQQFLGTDENLSTLEKKLEDELNNPSKDIELAKIDKEMKQDLYVQESFISLDIFQGRVGTIKIKNENYKYLDGEVKEVCFVREDNLPVCFWSSYQKGKLYFNVIPDKRRIHMGAYIDHSFKEGLNTDSDTYVLKLKNIENGIFENIYLVPKQRGLPLDLDIFVKKLRRRK